MCAQSSNEKYNTSLCTVHSIRCTVHCNSQFRVYTYSMRCTVLGVGCTLYIIHYSLLFAMYDVNCKVFSVQCSAYIVQYTVYGEQCVQRTVYTLLLTVYHRHGKV